MFKKKLSIIIIQSILLVLIFTNCEKKEFDNIPNPTTASLCQPDTVYSQGGYTAYVNDDCAGPGQTCLPEVVVVISRDSPCEELNVIESLENASQTEKRNILSENGIFFSSILSDEIFVNYVVDMIYNLDVNCVYSSNNCAKFHFKFYEGTNPSQNIVFVIPVNLQIIIVHD